MDDPSIFAGKGFLVTGAASGIGRATAQRLSDGGARVMLCDIHEDALRQIGEEMDQPYTVVDVTNYQQVKEALESAASTFGGIRGVVNSAGIQFAGLFTTVPIEQHRRVVEVNLIGSMNVAHAALPLLARTHGSLIFLGSISSAFGPPEFASYGASKGGVLNFAQSMHLEAEEQGVHVGVVTPLFVQSPMLDANATPALAANIGAVHTPEEVAEAVLESMVWRKLMIWPSWRPRAIFALTRYANFAGPTLMRLNWKQRGIARMWARRHQRDRA